MTYELFMELIEKAHRETQHWSVGHVKHEAIQRIFSEADADTVAYACLILQDHVHLAFTILYQLVPKEKRPPIPEYYAGRVPVMQACWQYWALKEGHVSTKYDPNAYWVEDKHGHRANWH